MKRLLTNTPTVAMMVVAICIGLGESAQAQDKKAPMVGPLSLSASEKIVAAAEKEAAKGSPSTIVVVDASGAPVLVRRMDGAFPASARIALGKAETAAAFWQSTTNIEAGANTGRPALLSSGYVVMQGGIPLTLNGQVVGAVGVSGGTKDQDEAVAKAGAAEVAK